MMTTCGAQHRATLKRRDLRVVPFVDWSGRECVEAAFWMLASRWGSVSDRLEHGVPLARRFVESKGPGRGGVARSADPLTVEQRESIRRLLRRGHDDTGEISKPVGALVMRRAVSMFINSEGSGVPTLVVEHYGMIEEAMGAAARPETVERARVDADRFTLALRDFLQGRRKRPGRPGAIKGLERLVRLTEEFLTAEAGAVEVTDSAIAKLILLWEARSTGRSEVPRSGRIEYSLHGRRHKLSLDSVRRQVGRIRRKR
jgi:hypothetical protein